MQQKLLKLSAILLLGFGLSGLQAQEGINTAGSNASGSGGTVSYSVGQVVCQTHSGANGSVAEGVQQPYEISEVTGLEEAESSNISVSVYPNPATDYLTLIINESDISDLSYQLYDMQGKLLQNEKITSHRTSIFMGDLVQAVYFVKVFQENKEVHYVQPNEFCTKQLYVVKAFKIIKTQ